MMKKWLIMLLTAALCTMGAACALADLILEPMGVFEFATGIDGNFRFTTKQTHADHSDGAIYISCLCGGQHDMNTIETEYRISSSPDFHYTFDFEIVNREIRDVEPEDGQPAKIAMDEWYNLVCTPIPGMKTEAGEYPLTFWIKARCGEHEGWAECTISVHVKDPDAQETGSEWEAEYRDRWSDFVWKLEYSSDKTYSFDDSGRTVWFIQKALKELRYYEGETSGHYGSLTREAVEGFQRAEKLPVTGVCDDKTMARLFRLYLGSTEVTYGKTFYTPKWDDARTKTWLQDVGVETGAVVKLIDLWTDMAINIRLGYIDGHIDAKPMTPNDTRLLCRMYGASSCDELKEMCEMGEYPYNGRPMLLVASKGGTDTQIVCSVDATPHGGYVMEENEYAGQFCIYLDRSTVHGTNKLDNAPGGHQDMIGRAAELMTQKNGTIGVGDIVTDKDAFAAMPPVEVPTLILPDGAAEDVSAVIKYDEPKNNGNNTIVYNMHATTLRGQGYDLPGVCTLCFPYPEGLDENSARTYRIIIHHQISDRETEVFKSEDGDIEFTKQGLCIQVRSFSPFIIDLGGDSQDVNLPKTGDSASLTLWFVLLGVTGAGMLLLRRRTHN